jgi:hypothetical protein
MNGVAGEHVPVQFFDRLAPAPDPNIGIIIVAVVIAGHGLPVRLPYSAAGVIAIQDTPAGGLATGPPGVVTRPLPRRVYG